MEEQKWLAGTAPQRIGDLMKNRRISQMTLAETTGINRSKLSRFISGATDSLPHEDIVKIARYFDVSTDFLLGETDEPDRINYDISELGLTVKAAKALYTRKVDPSMVSRILEHENCGRLMKSIDIGMTSE